MKHEWDGATAEGLLSDYLFLHSS